MASRLRGADSSFLEFASPACQKRLAVLSLYLLLPRSVPAHEASWHAGNCFHCWIRLHADIDFVGDVIFATDPLHLRILDSVVARGGVIRGLESEAAATRRRVDC